MTTATSFAYVGVTLKGEAEGGAFAAADDRMTRTVHRVRLLEGRRADPARADEVVVNPVMAAAAGLQAGQRATLVGVEGTGFSKEVTVVGIVLTANDLALNTGFAAVLLTPAFLDAHGDEVLVGRVQQYVRLDQGPAGIPEFRRAVLELSGAGGGVSVGDSDSEASGIQNALRLQALALALLAAAAAAATLLAVARASPVTSPPGPAKSRRCVRWA